MLQGRCRGFGAATRQLSSGMSRRGTGRLGPLTRQHPRRSFAQTSVRCTRSDDPGALYLIQPNGEKIRISKTPFRIGTDADADLTLQGDNVLGEHVEIDSRQGQVVVIALGGDPEDLSSETYTRLNDTPLRSNVAYLASAGSELQMGSDEAVWKLEFKETTSVDPVREAMLKALVSGFSEEAQKAFEDHSGL